jgi:hypothetical protein
MAGAAAIRIWVRHMLSFHDNWLTSIENNLSEQIIHIMAACDPRRYDPAPSSKDPSLIHPRAVQPCECKGRNGFVEDRMFLLAYESSSVARIQRTRIATYAFHYLCDGPDQERSHGLLKE